MATGLCEKCGESTHSFIKLLCASCEALLKPLSFKCEFAGWFHICMGFWGTRYKLKHATIYTLYIDVLFLIFSLQYTHKRR
jgi:hypothetical protein